MKLIKFLSCALAALAVMAACGGGGCNPCETEQPAPKVDCSSRPEVCK